MRKFVLFCASFCAMLIFFSTSPVRAQLVVYWVSPTGSDANNCAQTSPCATFQNAISVANGLQNAEIRCLSSGIYGPVNITTSLTIDCGAGNVGKIEDFSPSAGAVTINANSGATVVLRHLSISNFGSSGSGINATLSNGALIVEDCAISGFTNGYGIDFNPISGRGLLQVSNSQIFNNSTGIIATTGTSGLISTVSLNQVELVGNTDGLSLAGAGVIAGQMRNSLALGNGRYGVYSSASQVYFTIDTSSLVANLTAGIRAGSSGSNVNVTASTISGNGTGVSVFSGSVISFGNNTLNGNASNGSFTSTAALQ